MRMKEMEEMRELERKAEELQSMMEEDGGVWAEETEEERKHRARKELEKAAIEQVELRDSAKLMLEVGQKAYEKGSYGRAIEFFEGALTIISRLKLFGGEIQVWLVIAYEANNRHADCITLYKQLEKEASEDARLQSFATFCNRSARYLRRKWWQYLLLVQVTMPGITITA